MRGFGIVFVLLFSNLLCAQHFELKHINNGPIVKVGEVYIEKITIEPKLPGCELRVMANGVWVEVIADTAYYRVNFMDAGYYVFKIAAFYYNDNQLLFQDSFLEHCEAIRSPAILDVQKNIIYRNVDNVVYVSPINVNPDSLDVEMVDIFSTEIIPLHNQKDGKYIIRPDSNCGFLELRIFEIKNGRRELLGIKNFITIDPVCSGLRLIKDTADSGVLGIRIIPENYLDLMCQGWEIKIMEFDCQILNSRHKKNFHGNSEWIENELYLVLNNMKSGEKAIFENIKVSIYRGEDKFNSVHSFVYKK